MNNNQGNWQQTTSFVFFDKNGRDADLVSAIDEYVAQNPSIDFSSLCKSALSAFFNQSHGNPEAFQLNKRVQAIENFLNTVAYKIDKLEYHTNASSMNPASGKFEMPIPPAPPKQPFKERVVNTRVPREESASFSDFDRVNTTANANGRMSPPSAKVFKHGTSPDFGEDRLAVPHMSTNSAPKKHSASQEAAVAKISRFIDDF